MLWCRVLFGQRSLGTPKGVLVVAEQEAVPLIFSFQEHSMMGAITALLDVTSLTATL